MVSLVQDTSSVILYTTDMMYLVGECWIDVEEHQASHCNIISVSTFLSVWPHPLGKPRTVSAWYVCGQDCMESNHTYSAYEHGVELNAITKIASAGGDHTLNFDYLQLFLYSLINS